MPNTTRDDRESPPLIRPRTLIRTAQIAAQLYRRDRDLSGALPDTSRISVPDAQPDEKQSIRSGTPAVVQKLRAAEHDCEAMRRSRSPAYKPGLHIQILGALLAESAVCS